jgi:hypothetical protein
LPEDWGRKQHRGQQCRYFRLAGHPAASRLRPRLRRGRLDGAALGVRAKPRIAVAANLPRSAAYIKTDISAQRGSTGPGPCEPRRDGGD